MPADLGAVALLLLLLLWWKTLLLLLLLLLLRAGVPLLRTPRVPAVLQRESPCALRISL